jgi:hypothetical protein
VLTYLIVETAKKERKMMKGLLSIAFALVMFILMVTGAVVPSAFAGTSAVTFQWPPVTTMANGAPETNLAGYKIYQGTVSGTYGSPTLIPLTNCTTTPPLCGYTETGIADGTYYWVLTAYDKQGNESAKSNVVTQTLNTIPPAAPAGVVTITTTVTVTTP